MIWNVFINFIPTVFKTVFCFKKVENTHVCKRDSAVWMTQHKWIRKKFKLDIYKYLYWNGANASSDFQLMTDLYWSFRDEIWYDPSAKQEVATQLWLQDGEEITPIGWKHVPPLIQIIIIWQNHGDLTFQYKYRSITALKFLENNFICTIYENKKTFMELRKILFFVISYYIFYKIYAAFRNFKI